MALSPELSELLKSYQDPSDPLDKQTTERKKDVLRDLSNERLLAIALGLYGLGSRDREVIEEILQRMSSRLLEPPPAGL